LSISRPNQDSEGASCNPAKVILLLAIKSAFNVHAIQPLVHHADLGFKQKLPDPRARGVADPFARAEHRDSVEKHLDELTY
jgi:hypothetical protein